MEEHLILPIQVQPLLWPLKLAPHPCQLLLDQSLLAVLTLHEQFLDSFILIETSQFLSSLDAFNLSVDELTLQWKRHGLQHYPRLEGLTSLHIGIKYELIQRTLK